MRELPRAKSQTATIQTDRRNNENRIYRRREKKKNLLNKRQIKEKQLKLKELARNASKIGQAFKTNSLCDVIWELVGGTKDSLTQIN